MNIFKISAIGAIFLSAATFNFCNAQVKVDENGYYSNPKIGQKPARVTPYQDDEIASKSEDIVVVLQGEQAEDTIPTDSIKGNFDKEGYYDYEYSARINRFHRDMGGSYYADRYTNLFWYSHDPWMWGSSIYLGWGWGWGFGPAWGWHGYWSPYWSYGWSLCYGWDPFWGWGPYWAYDPYWGWGYGLGWDYYSYSSIYVGSFSGSFGQMGRGFGLQNMPGHQYLGGERGGRSHYYPNPTSRSAAASTAPARRGGVDINSNGRSGRDMTASSGRGSSIAGSTASPVRGGSASGPRYDKPQRVNDSRSVMSQSRSNSSRTNYGTVTSGRDAASSDNGYFRQSSTSSSRNSSSYSGSSSRSSSSSYSGSSSRSSSGSYSGGSSSRGGGSYSGGSSHSSGGGSHSSSSGSRR